MDLVRDRTLTRKGGKGEAFMSSANPVDQICASGEVIRTKVNLLARGNSQGIQQLYESLSTRREGSAPPSSPCKTGPALTGSCLARVNWTCAQALNLEVLKALDVDSLKKQLLKTDPGERAIQHRKTSRND